jgi:hypothetical protein
VQEIRYRTIPHGWAFRPKQYADAINSMFNNEDAKPEQPTDGELAVWSSIADEAT